MLTQPSIRHHRKGVSCFKIRTGLSHIDGVLPPGVSARSGLKHPVSHQHQLCSLLGVLMPVITNPLGPDRPDRRRAENGPAKSSSEMRRRSRADRPGPGATPPPASILRSSTSPNSPASDSAPPRRSQSSSGPGRHPRSAQNMTAPSETS